MNIKTPVVVVGMPSGWFLVQVNSASLCCCNTPQAANELATIINLHAELVQFVKHISERAGIESVERHQAYDLLAKCEQIGKGETP